MTMPEVKRLLMSAIIYYLYLLYTLINSRKTTFDYHVTTFRIFEGRELYFQSIQNRSNAEFMYLSRIFLVAARQEMQHALTLTQCSEDNRPASVLSTLPNGGYCQLILSVSLEPAQRDRLRVSGHDRHHPVTDHLVHSS